MVSPWTVHLLSWAAMGFVVCTEWTFYLAAVDFRRCLSSSVWMAAFFQGRQPLRQHFCDEEIDP